MSLLETIKAPALKALSDVRHAFFTRQGGVSVGRYASLNCSYRNQDHVNHVLENRSRVAAYFGCAERFLITPKAVHGHRVMIVDDLDVAYSTIEADALVTARNDVVLGLHSADCPIVLLADPIKQVVGIAHAGWRGAKSGILESIVYAMQQLGALPCHIIAAISPCIQQASYEVGAEFYQQFLQDNQNNILYFKNTSTINSYLFDLQSYVEGRLAALSIAAIQAIGLDTYSDERFFSCRRASHLGEEDFGCHFSCIGLV